MKNYFVLLFALSLLSFSWKTEKVNSTFLSGIYVNYCDSLSQKVIIIFNDKRTVIRADYENQSNNWSFKYLEVDVRENDENFNDSSELSLLLRYFDSETETYQFMDTAIPVISPCMTGKQIIGYNYTWLSDKSGFWHNPNRDVYSNAEIKKQKNYYSFVSKLDDHWPLSEDSLTLKLNQILFKY